MSRHRRGLAHVPPTEPWLSALAPWQAAGVCVLGALAVAPALVVPEMVVGRLSLGSLMAPIVRGLLGAALAATGVLVLVHTLPLAPAGLFLRRPTARTWRWGALALALAAILTGVSCVLAPGMPRWVGANDLALLYVLAAIAVGLWTGILEELFFRGVLLSVLGHRWSWPGAILASALLFGLLHQGSTEGQLAIALYVAITTVAGAFLGLLVVVTGNIWHAVAVHATWNAAFSGYLVGFEPAHRALVDLPDGAGWPVDLGGAALPESPLALLLFTLLLAAYWWRVRSPSCRP